MPLTPQTSYRPRRVVEPDFPDLPEDFKDKEQAKEWWFKSRKVILDKLERISSQIPQSVAGEAGPPGPAGEKGDPGRRGPSGATGGTGTTTGSDSDSSVVATATVLTKSIVLCAGMTPTATGADTAEIVVPYSDDGVTLVTWKVTRVTFRVGSAGGAPSMIVEKSSSTLAFSAVAITTVTLVADTYEAFVAGELGTVQSGDKLRFNAVDIATSGLWTVIVEVSNTGTT